VTDGQVIERGTEMLNRKQVNDEIERIVHEHEPTIKGDSYMAANLAVGEMIRELQAHMDATVEAALKEGAES
jgi:HAMP domain-containing protein